MDVNLGQFKNELGGRAENCVNCAVALDSSIGGSPATALTSNGPLRISMLEKQFGTSFSPMRSKAEGINNLVGELKQGGAGSRAIVTAWVDPRQPGHAFNAYLGRDGVVRFVDGQAGGPANLASWKYVKFIRTN